jgi:hypothetical protein
MQLQVYNWLRQINVGFEEVLSWLTALRKHSAFHRRELDRFSALAKETRASLNSYLAAVIEISETADAGRRYTKRRQREKREDEDT